MAPMPVRSPAPGRYLLHPGDNSWGKIKRRQSAILARFASGAGALGATTGFDCAGCYGGYRFGVAKSKVGHKEAKRSLWMPVDSVEAKNFGAAVARAGDESDHPNERKGGSPVKRSSPRKPVARAMGLDDHRAGVAMVVR